RAINGHSYVAEATKAKIFAAMRELNYHPNNIAQQLRGQGTKMIGVVISFITNPFFAYLVDAVDRALSAEGYRAVMLQTLEDPAKEAQYVAMLQSKQLDGLIMADLENDSDEVAELVQAGKIVLCNRYLGTRPLPIIQIDEEQAAYAATAYLLDRGYQRLAFCTGGERNPQDLRFKGFEKALADHGRTFNEAWYFSEVLTEGDGAALIKRLAANRPAGADGDTALPDAIFSNGDQVAAGMLQGARTAGWRVPDQLAIMGFDDQPVAALTNPTLTTVRQPIKAIGTAAAQTVLAHIRGEAVPPIPALTTTVVPRETTR
ncbi:LacI family DNA-binding transcriptional regulator, partial [Schleiferilactobacillus shenzhenensis]